jgi:hypothetical protein
MLMMLRPEMGAFCTVSGVSRHLRRVGLQQGGLRGDRDVLGHGSYVEPDVDSRSVAGGQCHAGHLALESGELGLHFVDANGQQLERVVAGITGHRRTTEIRGKTGRSHRDARQDGAARISDAADDVSGPLGSR